ncbi:MAG: alkaline phosphatase family protein [Actinobacteria bacterium]|nr:alkaline phosphatase family protein [Actinomycetota bacterium]
MSGGKVLVIGLDCASPGLLFDRFAGDLPNLESLMARGVHGELETCVPPITIPAWLVMFTGLDPGQLGLYGFRHRVERSYDGVWVANSEQISAPTVWDIAGAKGLRCCVVAVPPSYPPYPVNGDLVGCFLTPDGNSRYTYPAGLKVELEENGLSYVPDVKFRVEDKEGLLREIYDMSAGRFDIVDYLLENRAWDLFAFVEIGLDRIHHAFWKYQDPGHHLYRAGNPFEGAVRDYYRFLDERVGGMLERVDDETTVLVVSDHGAKRMKGAFCLNQWLVERGYLKLAGEPEAPTSLDDLEVDWDGTRAWAWGGYYARVFINLKGREPCGVVEPGEYEAFRDGLRSEIEAIKGPDGEDLDNRVWIPSELYEETRGDPPDLIVCLDDLYWRPAGTVGHPSLYLSENDTGPDDAVHDWKGVYIMAGPGVEAGARRDASIYQVAPTVLEALGLDVPAYMKAGLNNTG